MGPGNKLLFGTGPLEGTPVGMGRVSVMAKHVRKYFAEGGAGGDWAPELKFAGCDFLIVEGKSRRPVYIHINDSDVEIRDAGHLWGKDTREKKLRIMDETGIQDICVASIGPAGENLVSDAKVVFTRDHCGGRGCGTIMGDKKLAAVAVYGTGGVKIKEPVRFLAAYRRIRKLLDMKDTFDCFVPPFCFFAASTNLQVLNQNAQLHAYNAQRGTIANMHGPEEYLANHVTNPDGGFCCPFPACGRRYT